MTAPHVTVIVLAWNRWDLTRRCLASIARTTRPGEADVILVDNGSEDGTVAAAREFPWLRVVRLPENLGYVRGNNAGIAHADPDSDVVLLNNDVVLEDGDWLGKLRRAARSDPRTGIVAPRLVLDDGRLIHAGTYLVPETCWGQTLGRDEADIGQYPGSREVQGVVFAVVYIRREVLRALGPLPEEYVSFFEDTDYCLRARAAGFRVECTGDLTVRHETGATLSDQPERRLELFETSRSVFRQRWQGRLEEAYDLDLVAFTTAAERREYGAVLIDLLVALDGMGVRVAHRDRDGLAGIASSEGIWGRGHFARVFADRPPADGAVGLVLGGRRPRAPGPEPVVTAPVPIATTHDHPAARSVARRDGRVLLMARLREDEIEAGERLLEAFQRFSDPDVGGRLLLVVDPATSSQGLLGLLSTPSVASGRAAVVRDPFRDHGLACLYRSVDAFVSWRGDSFGSRDRWRALACGTPVLFVGDDADDDDARPFLHLPVAEPGASDRERVASALRWFAALPADRRFPFGPELRPIVDARSVDSVAASILNAARALRSQRIAT